ncbi:ATPase [Aureococcus anophagefferens]|nr:ATPase [Aureococcus anophagefferens]
MMMLDARVWVSTPVLVEVALFAVALLHLVVAAARRRTARPVSELAAPLLSTRDDAYAVVVDDEHAVKKTWSKDVGFGFTTQTLGCALAVYFLFAAVFFAQDGGALDEPAKAARVLRHALRCLAWCCAVYAEGVALRCARVRSRTFCFVFYAAAAAVDARETAAAFAAADCRVWAAALECVVFLVACDRRPVRREASSALPPEWRCSLASYFSFAWLEDLIAVGSKRPLAAADLPPPADGDRAARVLEAWGPPPATGSLWLFTLRRCGWRYGLQTFYRLVPTLVNGFASPFALNVVITFVQSRPAPGPVPPLVLAAAAGVAFLPVVAIFGDTHNVKIGRRLGVRARAYLTGCVLDALARSPCGAAEPGVVTNLVSVDAANVVNYMVQGQLLWAAALQLTLNILLLLDVLGAAGLFGVGVLVALMPASRAMKRRLARLQTQLMAKRDGRMRVIHEVIAGIRVVKAFGWEPEFAARVAAARAAEVRALAAYLYTTAAMLGVVLGAPSWIGIVTFLVHTQLLHRDLTAAQAFTALTLFNLLRWPLNALPDALNHWIQAKVAFARFEAFIRAAPPAEAGAAARDAGDIALAGTFSWPGADSPALQELDVVVRRGRLTCVYGPTASGKSSLLLALLGELDGPGARRRAAYVAQAPWILRATARDNVLFGTAYDAARYAAVVRACALDDDFARLAAGDLTEIGERGATLSGGQRQRLALARAAYADADLYVFDDVLSALDAHVGAHVFRRVVRDLLRGKTVVLATHQVLLNGQALALKAWVAALELENSGAAQRSKYVFFASATFGTLCLTRLAIAKGSLRGSRKVHDRVVAAVLAAPLAWFEATPAGRVLNRCASDVQTIDKDLMNELAMLAQYVLSLAGIVAVILYEIPVAAASVAPMVGFSYVFAGRYYACERRRFPPALSFRERCPRRQPRAQAARGVDAIAGLRRRRGARERRAPASEASSAARTTRASSGLVTARAFGATGRLREDCLRRVDVNSSALYQLFAVNSWLVVRLRCLGALVNGCVVAYALARAADLDGATVGLALSYSLGVTQAVTFTIKQHATVEMAANALERADEPCRSPGVAPDAPALRGVSFAVDGGERLGVCGRTGAGKSSLVAALFRLVEPAGGRVLVGGVDVAALRLADLRGSLSLIPQEPTLFRGSVRANLDPFGARSDAEIAAALARVAFRRSDLDAAVDDRGANFSAGEQQLLCLARALLRRSRILVLDEATASVDEGADARIQAALRGDDLAATTLLVIAHRLATIADFDKVAVLARGALVECDAPGALLGDPGSAFYDLCAATGDLAGLVARARGAAVR